MSKFKRKPYMTKDLGQFKFEFFYSEGKLEGTYLQITAKSGNWSMRIAGNNDTYGYLFAAADQNMLDQLHGYVTIMYVTSLAVTQEQGIADDIQRAIIKWHKRMEKKAETEAKNVTDEQEQAAQAFMGDIALEQGLSKKELKAKRKADKEIMREIITGDKTREL